MSTMQLPPAIKKSPNPTAVRPSSSTRLTSTSSSKSKSSAPPYHARFQQAKTLAQASKAGGAAAAQAAKDRFVPRSVEAFGDGGAFPEIHVAQYPRNMGNPNRNNASNSNSTALTATTSTALSTIEISADGSTNYDSIVKQGTNKDKKVFTSLADMRATTKDLKVDLPSTDDEIAAADKTAKALALIVNSKITKSLPTSSAISTAATTSGANANAHFVKYKPDKNAPGYNPNASERVIKIITAQIDPMEPPKHKHRKVPGGPKEDPVPVLHSPPRRLTVEDQMDWKIPPCISNWKNSKGYTIPLDKRLAADGRGLQENTINNNFATLSESLYIAERQAREEVRMRGMVQRRLGTEEKERKERELRELAQRARNERSGVNSSVMRGQEDDDDRGEERGYDGGGDDKYDRDDDEYREQEEAREEPRGQQTNNSSSSSSHQPTEDDIAAQQREKLRKSRKRDREREMRTENLKGNSKKQQRSDEDRDISEKIALGVHTGTAGGGVDSRLYNQSGGLDSGFGNDEAYNTYGKSLFGDKAGSSSVYRPSRGEGAVDADQLHSDLLESGTQRFKPDKGFAGTEATSNAQRDAPVQFEKGGNK